VDVLQLLALGMCVGVALSVLVRPYLAWMVLGLVSAR